MQYLKCKKAAVLCSWAECFTPLVTISTQEFKWVPVNCWAKTAKMLGVSCMQNQFWFETDFNMIPTRNFRLFKKQHHTFLFTMQLLLLPINMCSYVTQTIFFSQFIPSFPTHNFIMPSHRANHITASFIEPSTWCGYKHTQAWDPKQEREIGQYKM